MRAYSIDGLNGQNCPTPEITQIATELLNLSQATTRLQRTLERLSDEELPEGLRQRAEQILQRVVELRTEVRDRIDRLGQVTEQLSASKEVTAASLKQLAATIDEINQRLFRQDSKPLWRVGGDQWRSIFQPPEQISGQVRADFQGFVILQWPWMLLHLFMLAVIVTLIMQVRATTISWPDDDPQLQRAVGLAMAVSALGFSATQLTVLFGAASVRR
jgi:hypothetical protein